VTALAKVALEEVFPCASTFRETHSVLTQKREQVGYCYVTKCLRPNMRSGLVLTLFSAIETQNIIKYRNDQFYQFR
jgi:hypothetical protein